MLLVLLDSSSFESTPAASFCRESLGQMLAIVRTHWQVMAIEMLLLVSSALRRTCSRIVQQCYEAFWSPFPKISRILSILSWIQGAGIRWQSNSFGSLCSITCFKIITKLPARSRYFRGLSLIYCRQRLRAAAITLGSRSQSAFFIFYLYSGISVPVTILIFCRMRVAFFLTKSVVWVRSLMTCSVTADAMVALRTCPKEVRQITIQWTSPLVRSLMMVATSMIRRSLLLSKKREHMRQPMRLRNRFLFWVRLMACMWAKGAECPNIQMQSARIRCYLICLGVRFFSANLGLRVSSYPLMIRSSSCFDLVSPMFLISSLRSLERWDDAAVMLILMIYL